MSYLQLVGDHYEYDLPLPIFLRCDCMSAIINLLMGKNYIRNLKCTGCAEINCSECDCACHKLMRDVMRVDKDDD